MILRKTGLSLALILASQSTTAAITYNLDLISNTHAFVTGTITTNGTTGDNLILDGNLVIDWNIQLTSTFYGAIEIYNYNSSNSAFFSGSNAIVDVTETTIALDLGSFVQFDPHTSLISMADGSGWIEWSNPVEITDPGFEQITPPSFQYSAGYGSTMQFPRYDIIAEVSAVPLPSAIYLFATGMLGLMGLMRRR